MGENIFAVPACEIERGTNFKKVEACLSHTVTAFPLEHGIKLLAQLV